MDEKIYRLNEPDVSAEDFKSEILAVNLKNGHYHSLRGAAVPIWRLLLEGQTEPTIVDWLAPVYQQEPAALSADVAELIAALERDELIVPDASRTAASAPAPAWLKEISPPYAKPLMETYTEMRDLLLLDPVHDVDVSGWPNLPAPKTDKP